MIKTALYTLEIALGSTIIALLIGFPTAFFTSKRKFPLKKILLSTKVIPLCVPSLIIALVYVCFFGINGTLNNFLQKLFNLKNPPVKFLYTTAGIMIAQGFYNFPLITGIIHDAWCNLPSTQGNAARLLGASEKRVFFTITLKQLSGAIGAACIPVFLFSFFSFMIAMLFSPSGKSTLEVDLYYAVRSTLDIKKGTLIAIIETTIALITVFIYSHISKKSQTTSDGINFSHQSATKFKSKSEVLIFLSLIFVILLFFFFPFFSIISSSVKEFSKVIFSKSFFTAIKNSIFVGFFTATFSTILGFSYSLVIKFLKKQGSSIAQTIPLIPMAISSIVIGWISNLIFKRGSVLMLVILQCMLFWPIAYRQIQNGINMITKDTDNAAKLLSKNKFDSIIRIYLPSCKKVLKTSFGFCFAASLGDATLPLVLSIPRFNSLALYTYQLASAYRFDQACACGLILTVFCIFASFDFSFLHTKKNTVPTSKL